MLAQFEELTTKPMVALRQIEGWKDKIVDWIREEAVTGKMVKEIPPKNLAANLRLKLEPDQNSKAFKKLKGPTAKLLSICKKLPVDRVLAAAKLKVEALDDPKAADQGTRLNIDGIIDSICFELRLCLQIMTQ